MSKPEFHTSIPVLLSRDLKRAINFYTQRLGFTLTWLDEEGQDYAAQGRGDAGIHLALAASGKHQPSLQDMSTCEPAKVNFMVRNIDELWAEMSANGRGRLTGSPADQDYGVRDFSVIDAEGYQIRFNEFVS